MIQIKYFEREICTDITSLLKSCNFFKNMNQYLKRKLKMLPEQFFFVKKKT